MPGKKARWNKYEAAILIDAYMMVERGVCSCSEAVVYASKNLTHRSTCVGSKDNPDRFSIEEITKQFDIMNQIIAGEKVASRRNLKLFKKILELYRNDPEEFYEVLTKAWGDSYHGYNLSEEGHEKESEINADFESDQSESKAPEDLDRFIEEILRSNFQQGFDPNSILDRDRLLAFWGDTDNAPRKLNDDAILEAVEQIGISMDGKIYPPFTCEATALLETITRDIEETLHGGATAISEDSLYAKYEAEAQNKLNVYTSQGLADIVKTAIDLTSVRYEDGLFLYEDAILSNERFTTDISSCLRDFGAPMNFEEICSCLWYLTPESIQEALKLDSQVIKFDKDKYLHLSLVPMEESELNKMREGVDEYLQEHDYMPDEDLTSLAKRISPATIRFIEDNAPKESKKILAALLGDGYKKRALGIVKTGTEFKPSAEIDHFCQSREKATKQELIDLKNDLKFHSFYWEKIFESMIRISEDEFLNRKNVAFDVEAIDEVIDEILGAASFLTLKEAANNFISFPDIGMEWNGFVLESYVYCFSLQFKLVHLHFSSTRFQGAIVRREAPIKNYDELIVEALSLTDNWTTREEALSYLVDIGFQQRRSYKKIDVAIEKALQLRSERETGA